MNSLEIRESKIQLIETINGVNLPLEVKRMMLQEIMNELNSATEQEIETLLDKRNTEEKYEKSDSSENKIPEKPSNPTEKGE